METITKTREISYHVYIAVDGTEFDNETNCREYENTVFCTLRKRLKIRTKDFWTLFYGPEDNIVEIISGEKYDMQMYISYLLQKCPYLKMSEYEELLKNIRKNDEIVVFLNCENCCYLITTKEKLLERFENAYKGEE